MKRANIVYMLTKNRFMLHALFIVYSLCILFLFTFSINCKQNPNKVLHAAATQVYVFFLPKMNSISIAWFTGICEQSMRNVNAAHYTKNVYRNIVDLFGLYI